LTKLFVDNLIKRQKGNKIIWRRHSFC